MPTAAGTALLERFDRVRIVNLKARADRRREMRGELARLGLGLDDRIALHEACRPDDRGDFPSLGARGCFLSHLTVLDQAWDAGALLDRIAGLRELAGVARQVKRRLMRGR